MSDFGGVHDDVDDSDAQSDDSNRSGHQSKRRRLREVKKKCRKRFQCNICDYDTNKKSNFDRHCGTHTGISFPCPDCNQSCSTVASLKRHVKEKHSLQAPILTCQICAKYHSTRRSNVDQHSKNCKGGGDSVDEKSTIDDDDRQFGERCNRTLDWLAGEIGHFDKQFLVSAHKATLEEQIATYEPIYQKVIESENDIVELLKKDSGDPTLQRNLEMVQHQFDHLRRAAAERHTRLQTTIEHCNKYSVAIQELLTWLLLAEEKLAVMRPILLENSQLDQESNELRTFHSEVRKYCQRCYNTKSLGEAFLASCEIDKDPVIAELQNIEERWKKLDDELTTRAETLAVCARLLGEFNTKLRDLDKLVANCEYRLALHNALVSSTNGPEFLNPIHENAAALHEPLCNLRNLLENISAETHQASGANFEYLKVEVKAIGDRIHDLQTSLDDRSNELKSVAIATTHFNNKVKDLDYDLDGLVNTVNGLSPPGREIKVVSDQLNDVTRILKKIEQVAKKVSEIEQLSDADLTRKQIAANYRNTIRSVENRAKDREEILQTGLKALQHFYNEHSKAIDSFTAATAQILKLKPVSSELEKIQNQEERCQQNPIVERGELIVNEVNRLGQDLVNSDQYGVSTAVLKNDLKELNDKWTAIKEVHQFSNKHDMICIWLDSKENLLRILEPIASEPDGIQRQVAYVRVLRGEFSFQHSQLIDLRKIANTIFIRFQKSSVEVKTVEAMLKTVENTWTDLNGQLDSRARNLDAVAVVAQTFDTNLHSLRKTMLKISADLSANPTYDQYTELVNQLNEKRALLQDAKAASVALCNALSNVASNTDVITRFLVVAKLYQKLQKKLLRTLDKFSQPTYQHGAPIVIEDSEDDEPEEKQVEFVIDTNVFVDHMEAIIQVMGDGKHQFLIPHAVLCEINNLQESTREDICKERMSKCNSTIQRFQTDQNGKIGFQGSALDGRHLIHIQDRTRDDNIINCCLQMLG